MSVFNKLWENHPTVESFFDDFPCKTGDKIMFENQCAIRLGVALYKAGFETKSFKGAKCWHGHTHAHILRAEELANWLNGPFSPFLAMETFEGVSGFERIAQKKGVIFFKDYYGNNEQGDHIDLWNGSRLTRYSSWFEFAFLDGRHYSKATIWFWPVA